MLIQSNPLLASSHGESSTLQKLLKLSESIQSKTDSINNQANHNQSKETTGGKNQSSTKIGLPSTTQNLLSMALN
jgi:hypothetical protein